MFNIVLVEPEIPPNTGNIIRLAANSGCALHLVGPLGFLMEDRQLRRAGLDYHETANVQSFRDWDHFVAQQQPSPQRMFALTTRGSRSAYSVQFEPGDWLVFGSETRGLPEVIRAAFAVPQCLRLPMLRGQRSLNLSNAVAVVVFEAWRQHGFASADPQG